MAVQPAPQPRFAIAVSALSGPAKWSVARRSLSRAASIFINLSAVKRPRSALQIREKSAAAKQVNVAAFLTESPRSSSTAMTRVLRRRELQQIAISAAAGAPVLEQP